MNQTVFRRGFTLIELLIAVAVVAILAAIAIPSYSAYVVRGQRAAAKAVLLQAAQSMERAYTTGGAYPAAFPSPATPSCAALAPMDSGAASYCVTMTTAAPAPVAGFLLTATPCGISGLCPAAANNTFADADCGALTIDNTGAKSANGKLTPDQCWQR